MPAAALPSYSDSDVMGIVDVLVRKGKITAEIREKARMAFVTSGLTAANWLISQNKVSEADLAQAAAEFYNVPFVSLANRAISSVALGYVDRGIAQRFHLVPFDYKSDVKELWVAMTNPVDLAAVEFLEKKTGVNIRGFAATPSEVETAININYEQGLSGEVTAALKENTPAAENAVDNSNIQTEIKAEAPVARIVSKILEFAIKSRASDIHIEPSEDKTRVRYRIDGILSEKLIVPKNIHESLISRIKILSDLKIDEKRVPQDGRFTFKQEMEEIDLRVSTLPTVNGEKVVMRLLSKTGGVPALADLGLRGRALKNLEEAVLRPHGIVLVTGPTGSGKTTTLYSVLSRINTTKVNIVTIEDPVEYQMAGVNQVQINPAAGLTFASALRSFLRQDPNIIMVGEIRDEETAALAVQASLTGHLVFSTLHTNSAAGALPRLLDMKIEPYLLASSVTAIVGQRVARKLCASCKASYVPVPEVTADIAQVLGKLVPAGSQVSLMKSVGCAACGNTGYSGRVGIFEVLPIMEKIGRLTLERAPAVDIEREAIAEGMITMKQDGYLKVLEGTTTIEEVLRIAQE